MNKRSLGHLMAISAMLANTCAPAQVAYKTTPALMPLADSPEAVTYVTTKETCGCEACRAKIQAAAEKQARRAAAKLQRHPHLTKAPR